MVPVAGRNSTFHDRSLTAYAFILLRTNGDKVICINLRNCFQGDGYITTAVLRDILAALDDKLTDEDLDGIIEEVDEDGSGTVDLEGNFYHKKIIEVDRKLFKRDHL